MRIGCGGAPCPQHPSGLTEAPDRPVSLSHAGRDPEQRLPMLYWVVAVIAELAAWDSKGER